MATVDVKGLTLTLHALAAVLYPSRPIVGLTYLLNVQVWCVFVFEGVVSKSSSKMAQT